jgi:hypothetical protein
MLSWSRVLVVFVACAALPTLAVVACQPGLPIGTACGEIPSGGCPSDRGGTCKDPTCTGVYTCIDGEWKLDKTCPPEPDAGSGGGEPSDAAVDGDAAPLDACTPFMFNDQHQTQNCGPSLENPPDCPSQAAEGCLESACITGCTDFFMCTKKGWIDVGYCDDDGGFHDTQPK